jgi:hypothetical protein
LVFHQPITQPAAKPPIAPTKILKGTVYLRKKKQNRKKNHSLSPVPVENPEKKLLMVGLVPLLSLIMN